MSLSPLPDTLLRPLVENALREDLGRAGDITTQAIIPPDTLWQAAFVSRSAGVVAGLDAARLAFAVFDPSVSFTAHKKDGDRLERGDRLATVRGKAQSLLSAERVALNFLCHMSGIATATRQLVDAAQPHKARIACTRKTTPGLRAVEKYAVRAGGGVNHRFGLDDALLIKDNHIAVAGSVAEALRRARTAVGHLVKIEIEVDTLAQLDEVLDLLPTTPADVVMLDNMTPEQLHQAVTRTAGRVTLEASGGVTLASIAAIAATGVDIISCGALTHSAPILDIGLDVVG